MMRSPKRLVAIGLTAAVAAVGLEVATPVTAGATQVDLVCQGITGDAASSLGDSKATLGLLSTLSPGGGSGLTFSVEITSNAPAKATPGAGPFNVDFDLALTLPDSVVKPAKELLKLSSVQVSNANFGVTASGAADAELSTSLPSLTVDLNQSPVVVNQRISGTIDPTRSGTIFYKPSTNTRMTININAEVAGVKINSLTVTCGGDKDIITTAVQIPGSPNVTQPLYQVAYTASVVGRPLVGKDVTPDAGNPVLSDSLRLTSQAPNGGYSAVGGGAAFFLAPMEPGLYNAQYEVCAPSKTIPEVPGADTVQSLTWPESYVGREFNAHPVSMALQFKGQKTAPISLAQDAFGNPSPIKETEQGFLDIVGGKFVAPSAGQLQAALEKLSTIGAGNVEVTGGFNNAPYAIRFKNALGLSEQPRIEVVDFNSWLPGSLLTGALGALNPPPTTTTPGTPPTVTIPIVPIETLWTQLFAGQITSEQFSERLGAKIKADLIGGLTTPANITALTKLFPKPGEIAVSTIGKPTIPQAETGPLCTAFTVGYFVVPNPFLVQVAGTTTSRVTKCSTVRVKVKGKYVKKRVCKKVTVTKKR